MPLARPGENSSPSRTLSLQLACAIGLTSVNHHDLWYYMAEKRAGMAKWDEFVRAMLAKKRMKVAA
ncbi:hypothetical protein EOA79_25140 [Mesorhizobium sp. M1A.F.Ca.IN.020.03.2.1]|nr:hypothetical protein EOA79_25140 [Mesorhizobium sp. M1A.F.Ca.IN.020.03.2.1]